MAEHRLSQLLSQRQFVRFWLARLAGVMANQMLMVAVAWHMYDITSSAWDLGLVGLFQFIPALLMALPAGHVVDRLHRARIFACCMAIQGGRRAAPRRRDAGRLCDARTDPGGSR